MHTFEPSSFEPTALRGEGYVSAKGTTSLAWDARLSAQDREQLAAWNNTQLDYDRTQTLVSLFETQVTRSPHAIALVSGGTRLTYGELNARANRLAHYLLALGAGPEKLIGVSLERTCEAVVALLAILKTGAAYVPLDPVYPADRVAFMLQDSQAALLLSQSSLANRLPAYAGRLVWLDTDAPQYEQGPVENPPLIARLEQLAYVLFTSGSTGKPKGVALEHRNAVSFIASTKTDFADEDLNGVLAGTSFNFDLSIFELFVTLSRGGKVILAPNILELPRISAANEVRFIITVPSVMAELLELNGVPDSVRVICLGGEPLLQPFVEEIYRRTKVERVFNLYGPTETTTYSTNVLRERGGQHTIGRPIANTQIFLLDAQRQRVAIGEPGEIYIGGHGLTREYLRRPELTAERFLPHPIQPSERLYRTGDVGRFLADGKIEFLGRLDDQVKIRGYRIELGEIEAALRNHENVKDAVVVARELLPGDLRLIAYVVPRASAPSVEPLRGHLQRLLPEYMVPAYFVMVEKYPLTPSGKIDRQALPAPQQQAATEEEFVAPRDTEETKLAEVWCNLLKLQRVGVHDHFFALGGHSLLAVRMFAEIARRFGKQYPPATLFQAPTIAQLARLLREEASSVHWPSLVPIQPLGDKPPLFCVHGVGGHVLGFELLARHLGPQQPLFGLQAQGLDGKQPPHTTIEDMATFYIREIRTQQPQGPYFLAGQSFGGLVAYEMARQLQAAGERVGLVALFDTEATQRVSLSTTDALLRSVRFQFKRVGYHTTEFLKTSLNDKLAYLGRKTRTLQRRITSRLWEAGQWFGSRDANEQPLPAALRNVSESCWRAGRRYIAQPFAGRVALFRAEERSLSHDHDPSVGWRELALGGLEIIDVPGDHLTILQEPHVAQLAAALQACIDTACTR